MNIFATLAVVAPSAQAVLSADLLHKALATLAAGRALVVVSATRTQQPETKPIFTPYLPTAFTHETEYPEAFGRDLALQVRLIEERWRRHFPLLDYYSVSKTPEASPDAAVTMTGLTGGTTVDNLYGEPVDAVLDDAPWQQPHENAAVGAATDAVEVFLSPVKLYARVQREARENDLKLWGFDRLRDLLLFIPTSLFDAHGLRAQAGDKFIWDGDEFTVVQQEATGYWKNSNIRLYVAINAEHRRLGA